jgi:hypothetical protein
LIKYLIVCLIFLGGMSLSQSIVPCYELPL